MQNNWIVIASSEGAKIFEARKGKVALKLIEHMDHPEGRARRHELETDRPGGMAKSVGRNRNHGPRALQSHQDLKESGDEHFVKEMVDRLEHSRRDRLFSRMLLVAEKKLGPFFARHMPVELEKVTSTRLNKNFYQLPTEEIYDRLKEQIDYSFPV